MQKIGEIINIANKVFVKNIKKQIKKIKNSQFRDEVKNNLSMAGELLIDSIYMFNKKKTIAEISILRNVYEMTLKGIVLDKNEEIFNSYKIIKKSSYGRRRCRLPPQQQPPHSLCPSHSVPALPAGLLPQADPHRQRGYKEILSFGFSF